MIRHLKTLFSEKSPVVQKAAKLRLHPLCEASQEEGAVDSGSVFKEASELFTHEGKIERLRDKSNGAQRDRPVHFFRIVIA